MEQGDLDELVDVLVDEFEEYYREDFL